MADFWLILKKSIVKIFHHVDNILYTDGLNISHSRKEMEEWKDDGTAWWEYVMKSDLTDDSFLDFPIC